MPRDNVTVDLDDTRDKFSKRYNNWFCRLFSKKKPPIEDDYLMRKSIEYKGHEIIVYAKIAYIDRYNASFCCGWTVGNEGRYSNVGAEGIDKFIDENIANAKKHIDFINSLPDIINDVKEKISKL